MYKRLTFYFQNLFLNRSYVCIKLPIDQYNMTPHNRREMRPWKTI